MDGSGRTYPVQLEGNKKTAMVETYSNAADLYIGTEWESAAILIAFQGNLSSIILYY